LPSLSPLTTSSTRHIRQAPKPELANTRAHACQSCCREADPQTLIHFNNTPTADPADTVNALGRHLEYVPQLLATSPRLVVLTCGFLVLCAFSRTQTALLAWLQKQLQANGPLPLAALEQVPPATPVAQQQISFLTFFFCFRVLASNSTSCLTTGSRSLGTIPAG